MNLKNYTSSVPMANSISRIEHKLAQAGATHIAKKYEGERPIGMIFQIPINGTPMTFKLPAETDETFNYMVKQRARPPKENQIETIKKQAERTGWKILSDWVDIQVSLIIIKRVEPAEIFLSYLYDVKSDKTLYEKLKGSDFKLLKQ